jgi:hypothetical protein
LTWYDTRQPGAALAVAVEATTPATDNAATEVTAEPMSRIASLSSITADRSAVMERALSCVDERSVTSVTPRAGVTCS